MNISLEDLKKSEMKLTIELSKEEMAEYEKKAAKALQDQVKVPGFRPGHVPLDMLKKHVGEQAFQSQVVDAALQESYFNAIKEKGLQPVDFPKLNIVTHDPLKYEATFPVLPEVTWKKELTSIKLKAEKLEVKKDEIDEVLGNLKTRSTKWEKVDRKSKKGDRVELDFSGFDKDGKALDGTASQHHPLILGSNSMIPGFEEELEGLKAKDEKSFDITFPKDYHNDDFKNKKVTFKIKVHSVEEPIEPKLDDAFAAEITGGNRKTMKELKDEIKDELMKQKERTELTRQEGEFLEKLGKNVKADIPAALIEREIDMMIERIKQDLKHRKQSFEDYVKEVESKGKKLRDELKETAEKQVITRLALEQYHNEKKTEVSQEEIDQEIKEVLATVPPHFVQMYAQRFQDPKERDVLMRQLMLRKVVKTHIS